MFNVLQKTMEDYLKFVQLFPNKKVLQVTADLYSKERYDSKLVALTSSFTVVHDS